MVNTMIYYGILWNTMVYFHKGMVADVDSHLIGITAGVDLGLLAGEFQSVVVMSFCL